MSNNFLRAKQHALRHKDGRWYSFAGGKNYDGPQFSKDYRNAKIMSIQGARSVQKLLADPAYHGESFELVFISSGGPKL